MFVLPSFSVTAGFLGLRQWGRQPWQCCEECHRQSRIIFLSLELWLFISTSSILPFGYDDTDTGCHGLGIRCCPRASTFITAAVFITRVATTSVYIAAGCRKSVCIVTADTSVVYVVRGIAAATTGCSRNAVLWPLERSVRWHLPRAAAASAGSPRCVQRIAVRSLALNSGALRSGVHWRRWCWAWFCNSAARRLPCQGGQVQEGHGKAEK